MDKKVIQILRSKDPKNLIWILGSLDKKYLDTWVTGQKVYLDTWVTG